MSGKIRFGIDYFYVMRDLQIRSSDESSLDPKSDAAIKLFLFNWGLDLKEIDEANDEFFKIIESEELKLKDCFERIATHIKNDQEKIKRFITEYAAIASMDFNITEAEAAILPIFQHEFDLRKSELMKMLDRGSELALILSYLVEKSANK